MPDDARRRRPAVELSPLVALSVGAELGRRPVLLPGHHRNNMYRVFFPVCRDVLLWILIQFERACLGSR